MKSNFLVNLERELYFVEDEEREQIIAEYAVHFDERMKEGATETEVEAELGTAKAVAIDYATELGINYSSSAKVSSNAKRDGQLFFKSVKKNYQNIKNESAAKRQNRKKYTSNEVAHHNPNPHDISGFKRFCKGLISRIAIILYAIWSFFKFICIFAFRTFIGLIGLACLCVATVIIIFAILLPLFVSFTTNSTLIWGIIYLMIASSLYIYILIGYSLIKCFGRR